MLSNLSIFSLRSFVLGDMSIQLSFTKYNIINHFFLLVLSSFHYLYFKFQPIWNLFWFKACGKHLDFFSHSDSIDCVVCSQLLFPIYNYRISKELLLRKLYCLNVNKQTKPSKIDKILCLVNLTKKIICYHIATRMYLSVSSCVLPL